MSQTNNEILNIGELNIPGLIKIYPEITCDSLVIKPVTGYSASQEYTNIINIQFDDIVIDRLTIEEAVNVINQSTKYHAKKTTFITRYSNGEVEALVIEPTDRSTTINNFQLTRPEESESDGYLIGLNKVLYPHMGIDIGPSVNLYPLNPKNPYGFTNISFNAEKYTHQYHVVVNTNTILMHSDRDFNIISNIASNIVKHIFINTNTNDINTILAKIASFYPNELKAENNTLINISKFAGFTIDIYPTHIESPESIVKGKILTVNYNQEQVEELTRFFLENPAIDRFEFETDKHTVVTLSPHVKVNKFSFNPNFHNEGQVKIGNGLYYSSFNLSEISNYEPELRDTGLTTSSTDRRLIFSNPTDSPIRLENVNILGMTDGGVIIDNGYDYVIEGIPSYKSIVTSYIRFASLTFDNSITREYTDKLEFFINGESFNGNIAKDWEIRPTIMNRIVTNGTNNFRVSFYYDKDDNGKIINPNEIKVHVGQPGTDENRLKLVYNDNEPTKTIRMSDTTIATLTKGESVELIIDGNQ